MKRVLTLGLLVGTTILTSCSKKKDDGSSPEVIAPSKNGSALDLMRDSVFLYAKEAYYWNDGLPDYATFKPRTFTGSNDLAALAKEVDAISQYKINPATGRAYEFEESSPGNAKYSFIDGGETSTELGGTQGDFGFAPFYFGDNDLRIKYVYPGSPAAAFSIKRGYKVVSINGNTNISYDKGGSRTQFVVNAFFYSNSITLTLERPDGTQFTATVNANSYTTNPVITYKVFSGTGGHKIGYFVFNSFTSQANAQPKLDEAFNYFAANGVTDLVVDLRYNGGGYVSTSEYLSNLIAPAAKTGNLMYATYFNSILTSGKASILANQVRRDPSNNQTYNYTQFDYSVAGNYVYFKKAGPLNSVAKVCFIVGGGTASASELLINNILGLGSVDVKLIGSTTYGKPVGFFDIRINKYEMYIPEFETKNALGQGGYYIGMTPGSAQYPGQIGGDDISHDFGDPQETLLSYALNYINSGKYTTTSSQLQVQSLQQKGMFSVDESSDVGRKLDDGKFNGMIFDKPLKRK
ncbi:S41 family peptidase [Mucilaginibacter sp. HD30]